MGYNLLLLCIFAVCVNAATKACSTTSQTLFDEELDTYEPRIVCEGSQFRDPLCASYWLREKKLSRSCLTYKLCQDQQNAPYFEFAGTPSKPHGVFYKEQVATSSLVNSTYFSQQLAIGEELTNLRETVDNLWQENRDTLSLLIAKQWSETRQLITTEESNSRNVTQVDYGLATRNHVSTEAQEDRNNILNANMQTRSYDSQTEGDMRKHVQVEHDQTQANDKAEEANTRDLVNLHTQIQHALFMNETAQTRANITAETQRSSQQFKDNVNNEENATRKVTSETGTATQDLVRKEENATIVLAKSDHDRETKSSIEASHQLFHDSEPAILKESQDILTSITASSSSMQSSFGTLVSTISTVAASLSQMLNSTQKNTIENMLIHLNLQTDVSIYFLCIFNQVSPVDLFQRPEYLQRLRAVTNETVSYNAQKYGASTKANNNWVTGESYRASGNYRYAAYYYRLAYRYATVPN